MQNDPLLVCGLATQKSQSAFGSRAPMSLISASSALNMLAQPEPFTTPHFWARSRVVSKIGLCFAKEFQHLVRASPSQPQ